MLKSIVFSLLLLVVRPTFAQKPSGNAAKRVKSSTYCTIIETHGECRDGIALDYGQWGFPVVHDSQLAANISDIQNLRSVVAALNYMSNLGWDCVNFNVSVFQISNGLCQETCYLLRKRQQ